MSVERKTAGVTRTVFLVGRYAFKVPCCRYGWRLFLNGLLANMQEVAFGTLGWSALCPVRWSIAGGWLVVMDRARPLTDAEFAVFDYDAFVATAAECILPVERKPDSFGWLCGRVVALDYGS